MKRKDNKPAIGVLSQQAGKIKISNNIPSIANADFYKKKMEKGAKTLASCPLPE